MSAATGNLLGSYLKDRRSRLDPAAFGLPVARRRTKGLRREEVAQRANISPTWYTWLEQGRGGAPSADVLNRIAHGLMLTEPEREHLFLLGLGRPPEVRYKAVDGITPRLQRLIDSFEVSATIVKTALWDIVAWNRAATILLTDYGALPPGRHNILRLIFCHPGVRAVQDDWMKVARFAVGAFRADAARAGAVAELADLVDELCQISPEFAALWRDNDVSGHGEGVKHLRHPVLGSIAVEYSAFAVDGRPDLSMIVYNPIHLADADRVRALVRSGEAAHG
ncbi:helix-turn-helix transcriptional regulator [Acidisoma silvae]|uniref:Helix-turn-helix domain-containing protein n=1 Tax=Acidisoma silvae TaxID=2802396 RepID=A0A963YU34_9PROT|nr:helix-turn-helix transcriptional regulator [Acidisoma silvae]MCB8877093.1 helix-turn-helix domain-containing protein [Acidisoma silvae]